MAEAEQPPVAAKAPDTPVPNPPSRLDAIKSFVGDLARPFAIIATSAAASIATVIIAVKSVPDLAGAAVFIGAVFTGVGALYAAKSWEANVQAKQAATVAVAQANSSGTSQP